MNLFRIYLRLIEGHRRQAVLFLSASVVSGLLEVFALAPLVPLVQSAQAGAVPARYVVLGHVLEGPSFRVAALTAFATLGLLSATTKLVAEFVAIRLFAAVERSLRTRLTRVSLEMHWSAFVQLRLGELAASGLISPPQVAYGVTSMMRASAMVVVALALGVVAVGFAPGLSLFAFGFAVVAAVAYRWSGVRAEGHAEILRQSAQAIAAQIGDVFGNFKLFRSTGSTAKSEARINELYDSYASAYVKGNRYTPAMRFAFEAGAVLFLGAILLLALLTTGRFTPRALAFLLVFYRLSPRALWAQELFQQARSQRPWAEAWEAQITAAEAARADTSVGELPVFDHVLAAEHVSLSFGSADKVLDDVSWTIGRGQCLVLLGDSGAGKTSMLDLVSGLLRPSAGRITVDGADLAELDVAAWQRRIGLVLQEAPLFNLSVAENVAWPEDEPDAGRVASALEWANASAFVTALPQGAGTLVGERGGRLSGGERQRIAIARALYRDPWLLLLDEPTSALDSESEAAVRDTLAGLKRRCTMIVVTHRPALAVLADRVVSLDHGRMTNVGSVTARGPEHPEPSA